MDFLNTFLFWSLFYTESKIQKKGVLKWIIEWILIIGFVEYKR